MDLRTRRLLHDEVLPGLQAALIALDGPPASDRGEAMALLTGVHRQVAALLRQMPSAATAELARLGLVAALERSIAAEHAESFDQLVSSTTPCAN
jgi:hypothetical protein